VTPATSSDGDSGVERAPRTVGSPAWNLTTRVFVSTAAIVCVVVAAAFLIGSRSLRQASDEAARRGLEQSADLVAQFLTGRERSLAGGARVFVQGPYFRTLVAERRRDDILDQSFEAVAQLGANWVMITDDRGVLLAKSDEPKLVDDSLGGVPLVSGALRGGITSGFGVSRDSLLFQAVAVPIVIPGTAPVGVLVATRLVDSVFAADVKVGAASDVLFYARDASGNLRITSSTLGRDTSVAAAAEALAQKPDGPRGTPPTVRVRGAEYFGHAGTLTTAGGDVIGGFAVLRARDAEVVLIRGVRRSLAIAGSLGFVLALLFAYLAARHVTRPVRALSKTVRRAADGDYHTSIADRAAVPASDSEISALVVAFDRLLADLRDKESLVATVMGAATAESARQTGTRVHVVRAHAGSIGTARTMRRGGLTFAAGEMLADRYRIEAEIGSGGMGIVYRATDCLLGELVAVKLLRPEVLAADPQAFERLTQELRLARRITHRNVVRTHDLGESDGVPFLTMEYVQGSSLASVIASRGALSPPAVLSIAKQLLRGLDVAHEQGVIHGDLKPQNLLIGANGVLKVTDFGIARLIRGAVPERERRAAQAAEASLLAQLAGAVTGTPQYMAPEQLIGGPASPRSDIYAAGIVLHECLTGATPYGADTPMAFIARKLDATVSPIEPRPATTRLATSDADATETLARELEALIVEMTRPEPGDRPGSAAELVERLSRME
jgi:eukaryotic-like serine/threonine-protein kinase